MFISTPSGRNHFYDMYKLGASEKDDEWKSWLFKTIDNETIDCCGRRESGARTVAQGRSIVGQAS
jgi:DNA-directed RNA polymerase specialized sigma24 family protein